MDHSPVRAFSDGRVANRVCMWVNKFHEQTTVTASYPRNPIAYESIAWYRETMRSDLSGWPMAARSPSPDAGPASAVNPQVRRFRLGFVTNA